MNQGWNPVVLLAWVLCASTAMAEPDTFGLGTGREGALRVTEPRKVVNRYTQVTGPLAPGDTVLSVSSTEGFAAGDLVMVVQTTGIVPEPARGDPGPIQLSHDPVGRWELARVSAAGGQELKLMAPLLSSYAGMVTQVIRVPEYTDVKVEAGASLVAVPWDGRQGGVLAFLASGLIQNEGELQASGAGFRGGLAVAESPGFIGCATLPAAVRPGAGRGEGISSLDFGLWATGLENASNGGGGGLCPSSGGGGGGNGAAGGRGGDSLTYGDSVRDIGGKGGAGLVYSLIDHLTLGGGGGQGYGGGSHSQAGAGGGAIFVRGYRLAGSGAILANGFAGEDATQGGAGGGGAGGNISLRIGDSAECGLISARGGNGGSSLAGPLENAGPGGGGGGGRVLYQAARTGSCPMSVEAGHAGDLVGAAPGLGSGAQPTVSQLSAHRGTITLLEAGFEKNLVCTLPAPVFTRPLDGQSVNARPTFEGTIDTSYQTNDGVRVFVGGTDTTGGMATVNLATRTWSFTPGADLIDSVSYAMKARGTCNNPNTLSDYIAVITVTVDKRAPDTALVTTPADPHSEVNATFSFKAVGETRPVTFKCMLDALAEVSCGGGAATDVVAYEVTGLTDGSHTFSVAAVDEAGNRDPSSVSFTWTVDLRPDTFIDRQPSNPTNSQDALFELRSSKGGSTFKCRLDAGTWADCTNSQSYTSLTEGSHTFEAKSIEGTKEDLTPASYTWVVDTVPPDTSIGQKPVDPSNSASATFTFNSTGGGTSFECSLDSAPYAACTSPKSYGGLTDTSHTFSVRARDAAGNVDLSPATYTWWVDTAAPDTSIDQKPSNPSNSATATFTFSASETGSGFECSLDSAVYTLCTSPQNLSNLSEGSHTFSVRARDVAGNLDLTPASYSWGVDTVPPNTSIDQKPSDPSNTSSAIFTFSSTEAGSSFECSQDSAPYAPCVTPLTLLALAEGSHTFSVRAKDAAGNTDLTPATYSWVVDTVAPETSIDQKPPNPSSSTTAVFTFSATGEASNFECSLDSAQYAACTSPTTYSNLPNNSHTFSVRAKDAAGNTDSTPATYTWVVDTLPPETAIDQKPSNPSNSASATFAFSATGGGVAFECSLDSAAYVACTSPAAYGGLAEGSHTFSVRAQDAAGNTDPTPATYSWGVDTVAPDTVIDQKPASPSSTSSATFAFSSNEAGSSFECSLDLAAYAACTSPVQLVVVDGSHTFSVKARDAAGNVDPTPASYTWEVDTVPPDTSIDQKPPNPSNNARATFAFSATGGAIGFECSLDLAPYAACTSPLTTPALVEGNHSFLVRAKDAAGNLDPSAASYSWVVDTMAPDTLLTGTPANPSSSSAATFSFSSTEVGSSFECSLDLAVYTSCTSPWSSEGLAEGNHVFSVRARDVAGNTDPTPATYTWEVDTVAPDTVIDQKPPNPSNSARATFTFRALGSASGFECSLDAQPYASCTSPWNSAILAEGSHTFSVRARDAAGNTDPTPATYSWGVDTVPPDTSIDQKPLNPSNSSSATFTFSSNETGVSFECSLDAQPYASCTSPATYPGLAEASHTFSVRAKDVAGNTDPSPATYTWAVDTGAPETGIDQKPPNPSNNPTATFTFTSTEPGSSFECSLDSAAYVPCPSPAAFSVSEGSHTLSVRAKDAAGNRDPTPATYAWEVDLTAPNAVIDEASKPRNPTNETRVTFTFSGAGTGGSYWCRLDDQLYVECSSGSITYPSLSPRVHTFAVYAVDAAGNDDRQTPATHIWEVDTEAPDTVIEEASKPPNPTNLTSATFRFSGAGPGGHYFCALDSATYVTCDSGVMQYTSLGGGEHDFRVYGVDAAGNAEQSPAEYRWVVDSEPPVTTINEITEADGIAGRNPTNSTRITFRFSGADVPGKYWCSLDSSAHTPCGGSSGPGNSGVQEYTGLGAGRHLFSVYAGDAAGNLDPSPATYEWVVDLQEPVTSVINPVTNAVTKIWRTHQTSPSFKGTSEPRSEVVLRIDELGAERQQMGDSGDWELATQHLLADGRHKVSVVEATDPVGNKWTPPSGGTLPTPSAFEFIVDTVPPETEIVDKPPEIHNSIRVLFTFEAPGEQPELNTSFECRIVAHRLDKEFVGKCSKDQPYNLMTIFGITSANIKDVNGKYTIFTAARDEAGNLDSTPAFYSFDVVVDPPGPPEVTDPVDGAVVYDLTPTISGKTVSRGTVEFFLGEVKAGLARADEQGLFTFRFPEPLEQTPYVLSAVVTDLAGNPSARSSPISFTVVAPKPQAHAIGGGLGCAASTAEPWLAALGVFAGAALRSRRRRR